MSDYIDRKAAIDIACGNCLLNCQLDIETRASYCETVKQLITLPSADVKPVVFCKDCKHRDPEDGKCDNGHTISWQLARPDEWYCADGERRGNDNG